MTKLFDVKSKFELSTKTEVLNPYVDSLWDQIRYLKGKNETKHYQRIKAIILIQVQISSYNNDNNKKTVFN